MVDLYNKNLEYIKHSTPELYRLLKDSDIDSSIEETKDGNYTIKVKKDNREIYLHSKYRPVLEAERCIDNLRVEEDKVVILIGCGLGYHVDYILNSNNFERLVVIENNLQIIKALMHLKDFEELLTKIEFVWNIENNRLANYIEKNFEYMDIYNMRIIQFPKYCDIFSEMAVESLKQLKNVKHRLTIMTATQINFESEWVMNPFKNVIPIAEATSTSVLRDKFADVPAIIVSGGPSLNKNIEYLKKAKGRAVIIAGGRTIPAIINQGIKPDIVVSVDSGQPNAELFYDYLDLDTPMVMDGKVHSLIANEYEGDKFITDFGNEVTQNLLEVLNKKDDELEQAPSIACTSALIAESMGCNPIILIGQDLAYTNMKAHFKELNNDFELIEEDIKRKVYKNKITGKRVTITLEVDNKNKNLVYHYDSEDENIIIEDKETPFYGTVKGSHQHEVLTTHQLFIYLNWFKEHIACSEYNYINATEGGAFIDGSEHAVLKDVIEQYCIDRVEVKGILRQSYEKNGIENIDNLYIYLKKLNKSLENILDLCHENDRILRDMEKQRVNTDMNKVNKLLNKADNIDDRIKSEESIKYVNMLMWSVTLKLATNEELVIKEDETFTKKLNKLILRSRITYDAIKENAQELSKILEIAIEEVEYKYIVKVFNCTINIV